MNHLTKKVDLRKKHFEVALDLTAEPSVKMGEFENNGMQWRATPGAQCIAAIKITCEIRDQRVLERTNASTQLCRLLLLMYNRRKKRRKCFI